MSDITITPPQNFGAQWRATRAMPADWARVARQLHGMRVQEGEAGEPFIEATGRTPDEAVRNLYTAIGESWLALDAAEHWEIPVGARAADIRTKLEFTLEEAQAVILVTHGGVMVSERERELCGSALLRIQAWSIEANDRRRHGKPPEEPA